MTDVNSPFNRAMGLAEAECNRLNGIVAQNRDEDPFWQPANRLVYIAGKSGRVGSQMPELQNLTGDADMADAICLFNGIKWVPSALSGGNAWIVAPDYSKIVIDEYPDDDDIIDVWKVGYKYAKVTSGDWDKLDWTSIDGTYVNVLRTAYLAVFGGTIDIKGTVIEEYEYEKMSDISISVHPTYGDTDICGLKFADGNLGQSLLLKRVKVTYHPITTQTISGNYPAINFSLFYGNYISFNESFFYTLLGNDANSFVMYFLGNSVGTNTGHGLSDGTGLEVRMVSDDSGGYVDILQINERTYSTYDYSTCYARATLESYGYFLGIGDYQMSYHVSSPEYPVSNNKYVPFFYMGISDFFNKNQFFTVATTQYPILTGPAPSEVVVELPIFFFMKDPSYEGFNEWEIIFSATGS